MTERGVPAEVIVRENEARSSFGSLQAVSDELASRGMQRVVLVSDPYHSYRIEAMADDLGLDAGVSPTRRSPTGGTSRWKALLRETAAVSAGRIVGWDTLVDLEHSY
jgi:uncharacterized SAM-binding protein YcdF (DUF218 family)